MKGRTASYVSERGELVEVDLTAEQANLLPSSTAHLGGETGIPIPPLSVPLGPD